MKNKALGALANPPLRVTWRSPRSARPAGRASRNGWVERLPWTARWCQGTLPCALVAGSTLWCLSIIAAPLLDLSFVYDFFSRICHQIPGRSWHIFGEPLPVCIRCTSIYFGFTVALWLGLQTNVRWLRAALVVTLLEFALAQTVMDLAIFRSLSGIFVGLSAAPFVRRGVEEIRDSMQTVRR